MQLTYRDETKNMALVSQIVSQFDPWWAKLKIDIRHQPGDESFMSGLLFSLKPGPSSFN